MKQVFFVQNTIACYLALKLASSNDIIVYDKYFHLALALCRNSKASIIRFNRVLLLWIKLSTLFRIFLHLETSIYVPHGKFVNQYFKFFPKVLSLVEDGIDNIRYNPKNTTERQLNSFRSILTFQEYRTLSNLSNPKTKVVKYRFLDILNQSNESKDDKSQELLQLKTHSSSCPIAADFKVVVIESRFVDYKFISDLEDILKSTIYGPSTLFFTHPNRSKQIFDKDDFSLAIASEPEKNLIKVKNKAIISGSSFFTIFALCTYDRSNTFYLPLPVLNDLNLAQLSFYKSLNIQQIGSTIIKVNLLK